MPSENPVATPAIVETLIGQNGAPDSRLAHFARVMDATGDRVDVATMRFCHIDFAADTHLGSLPGSLQQSHHDTLSTLADLYRKTRFVHVTVPLTVTRSGAKAIVKRILGRPRAERET